MMVPTAMSAREDGECALRMGTPPRLLVIEDDAAMRVAIVLTAQKLGYETAEAATVADAAALIASDRFDCMTLDLRMGGHYGTELLDAISARQGGVPVIVVSSADDDERWDVLRVATLYGIRVAEVPKPLDFARLRAAFEEFRGPGPAGAETAIPSECDPV